MLYTHTYTYTTWECVRESERKREIRSVYTYSHINTYTHAYIHTYTHTYIQHERVWQKNYDNEAEAHAANAMYAYMCVCMYG